MGRSSRKRSPAARRPGRRKGQILKIVLFGSFARDNWCRRAADGYQSDWDILIIVSNEKLTPIENFWWEAEEKLLRDRRVKRPGHSHRAYAGASE